MRGLPTSACIEKITVKITGDMGKVVTPAINDGIFGINAALGWRSSQAPDGGLC